jgi:predicted MFS family arabinose efflux permease
MSGSMVMGIALKRIGYPVGFAAAGGVSLVALVLFFLMMREKQMDQAG